MSNNLLEIKNDIFKVSAEELIIGQIVKKEDFAVIQGKIEPTRDLALKLFAIAKLNYDTEMIPPISRQDETIYYVKARVYKNNEKVADGLGACSTKEVRGERQHHDALARAETRAFKRALEACVGLPFINELILQLFGGYEKKNGERVETPAITPDEFISKIREAKALPHLHNIWTKYCANLKTYSAEDKERVRLEKENRKLQLRREESNVS